MFQLPQGCHEAQGGCLISSLSLSALQPPHSPPPLSYITGPILCAGTPRDDMSILSCMVQYYLVRSLVGYVVCSAPGIRTQ